MKMTNDEISFDRVVKDDELRYLKQLLNKKQKQKKTKDRVKLKCAIYARKSQEDKKDLSLNAQINYCRAIIDSCDILELSNIYQEDDVSGMWDNRTEFQKMIQDVRDQVIDVIIVYKWHRFSRKVSDMENYYLEIIKYNGYLLSGDALYVVDTATALSNIITTWANNEFHARETAENTMNAFIKNFNDKKVYLAR